jgi:hypothetical protein
VTSEMLTGAVTPTPGRISTRPSTRGCERNMSVARHERGAMRSDQVQTLTNVAAIPG